MGRKTKSRRTLLSKKKRMSSVKGKFRETKEYAAIKKKTVKKSPRTKKYKVTKPKVDRSKKTSLIKKMRDLAKSFESKNE